ncbi:LysR family transcriptional regulator [Roseomonas sp. CAU 1739]|uniref:LysR family transcriptional regulator n=1 Tax=Roseomonas sp. CAU 1739 TaxID=3140364 RepID=UPI00325A80E5
MPPPPDWVTLRLFLTCLDAGSVTRAADRCGIAVSAATRRLQLLESDLGVALLARSSRGVRATAAGEALAVHARGLLDRLSLLADDMRAFAAGGRGSVRLHATASAITGQRLAESLAGFAQRQPGIRVELTEATALTVLRALIDGQADIGIVSRSDALPEGLVAHPWRTDRLVVAMPAAHRFAGRDALRYAEVLEEPMIGVLAGGSLALRLEDEAERLGRTPRWRFRVQGTDAARHLIAAGHGIGVMPEGVVLPHAAGFGLRGVTLAEPWAERQLSLVVRDDAALPPPVWLLRDHLADDCA